MKIKHICIECGKVEEREAFVYQGKMIHDNVQMLCKKCFLKKLKKGE